ncbi:FAD:protein FMN transferase [Candidatus Ulvibacter alkanivorans]|uniref:FAD:protein FMN transferase n=1 Tax=Candidatus Ulvibacter alkanivorans TaxID=2267620 RepID=UPI000DF1A9FD|nr:FAD:protein FMN transferase [Candidatus Ulvibacter alkanivorans]
MTRVFYFLIFLMVSVACVEKTPQPKVQQGNAFGTTYTIQFYSERNVDMSRGVDSVINQINQSVSTYMPTSDISKINKGDSTIVVDDIFKEVYVISEKVYKESSGYFDPTIGVLRNAYGFGDVKPLERIDSPVLDSLMRYVGFQKVSITSEGTVKKEHPEIYFDFNAVAKGYGIDRIGAYLEAEGIENFLIELGGELLAKGQNIAKNKPWVVGIEAVDSALDNRNYEATVPLVDRAMASSGNYRKFRIDSITGKRFVHTINPLTGSAEKSDVTSATILAPTCALADAYATACMALGLEKSKVLLASLPNVEAYLTYQDGEQSRVYQTPGMAAIMKTN